MTTPPTTDGGERPAQGIVVIGQNPRWCKAPKAPMLKGWYITRRDDGFISWRAWGNGAWWKQHGKGWVEWFNGDGEAMRFDWLRSPRMSIKLDQHQLPAIADDAQHAARKKGE